MRVSAPLLGSPGMAETKGAPPCYELEEISGSNEGGEEEAARAQVYPIPGEPSERERLLHEATHLPYRNWCKYCLIGRARSHPHASVDHSEDTIPVVSMDYFS